MNRKKNLLILCLPLAAMIGVTAWAGNHLVKQYPVDQRLDVTVLAAIGAVIVGVLLTAWWGQLSLRRRDVDRGSLLADAQQVMHDYAWLPVAFALYLSTSLFVIAVAALTGAWYMLDRFSRIERDRAEKAVLA